MGAWGAGSFDNDAAMDFAATIGTVDDLEASFAPALAKLALDADLACRILVAAECVAAMRGHRSRAMPPELAETVYGFGVPSRMLHDQAKWAVSAVMSSELAELWAEAKKRGPFNRAVTGLIDRLCREPKPPGKPRVPRKLEVYDNPAPCSFCNERMGPVEDSQFSISLAVNGLSGQKRFGFAHLECLNAALHPRHIIQHWRFEGAEMEAEVARILGFEPAART